eukprot:FR742627.1.p1 GENE.FR742627.1~~FR742627.1.p1  ORF type:complete len:237 (+),score=0.97 FR742627.1:96-806(+)
MVTDDANMTQNVFREEALRLAEEQQLKLEADEAQTRAHQQASERRDTQHVAELEQTAAKVIMEAAQLLRREQEMMAAEVEKQPFEMSEVRPDGSFPKPTGHTLANNMVPSTRLRSPGAASSVKQSRGSGSRNTIRSTTRGSNSPRSYTKSSNADDRSTASGRTTRDTTATGLRQVHTVGHNQRTGDSTKERLSSKRPTIPAPSRIRRPMTSRIQRPVVIKGRGMSSQNRLWGLDKT